MYMSIFCESNETLVKKTVISRCKHIAIIGVSTFVFVCDCPRLYMACYEQTIVCHHGKWTIRALLQQLLTVFLLSLTPSSDGHRFRPLRFSRKSKMFRMSMPSSLRKVGCMPPTMTTFRKLSLICLSDRSSCSVFSSDNKA